MRNNSRLTGREQKKLRRLERRLKKITGWDRTSQFPRFVFGPLILGSFVAAFTQIEPAFVVLGILGSTIVGTSLYHLRWDRGKGNTCRVERNVARLETKIKRIRVSSDPLSPEGGLSDSSQEDGEGKLSLAFQGGEASVSKK